MFARAVHIRAYFTFLSHVECEINTWNVPLSASCVWSLVFHEAGERRGKSKCWFHCIAPLYFEDHFTDKCNAHFALGCSTAWSELLFCVKRDPRQQGWREEEGWKSPLLTIGNFRDESQILPYYVGWNLRFSMDISKPYFVFVTLHHLYLALVCSLISCANRTGNKWVCIHPAFIRRLLDQWLTQLMTSPPNRFFPCQGSTWRPTGRQLQVK